MKYRLKLYFEAREVKTYTEIETYRSCIWFHKLVHALAIYWMHEDFLVITFKDCLEQTKTGLDHSRKFKIKK